MIKIILIVVLLILVALLVAGYYVFYSVFDQTNFRKNSQIERDRPDDSLNKLMYPTQLELFNYSKAYKDVIKNLPFEDLAIKSFDNLNLHGYLLKQSEEEVVLCYHGYRSRPKDFADKIEMYLKRNASILLVDDRGHGKSEGKYLGFSELDPLDVEKWVDKLNEIFKNPRIYLHGISMGGATVIHCANKDLKNVKGIIDDCGFDSAYHITQALMKDVYHVPFFPIGYFAFFFSKLIAHIDLMKTDGVACVKNSKYPIVFIHGKEDRFVPCWMSEVLYDNCVSAKRILIVEGAGHAASYMMAKDKYSELVNDLMDNKIK